MTNKRKIILSVIGVAVSMVMLITSSILTEEAVISSTLAIVLTVFSIGLVLVAIIFAVKIDYETSVYECGRCGHTFKPTFMSYVLGAHTLRTRHLKCPRCKEKSGCKREFLTDKNV